MRRTSRTGKRFLDIGPGSRRIKGFETLNIVGPATIVADAGKPLPIESETYDVVHASHVLEHIPWYDTYTALLEWVRILKRGGRLEVWVPDARFVAETLLKDEGIPDGNLLYNKGKDLCKWAAYRIMGHGPDPMWHKALFTPGYLLACLRKARLKDVGLLEKPRTGGHSEALNLGAWGRRP